MPYILTALVAVVLLAVYWRTRSRDPKTVIVLVMGDLGHSPRMLNHAVELVRDGFDVRLVGYLESRLPDDVEIVIGAGISVYNMEEPGRFNDDDTADKIIRAIHMSFSLFAALFVTCPFSAHLLVQIPPSVPVLPLAIGYSYMTKTKLTLDWHNLGDSVLALSLGKEHYMVRGIAFVEKYFGKLATQHLVVSEAMAEHLGKNFGVKGQNTKVIYDRPSSRFRPLNDSQKEETRNNLSEKYSGLASVLQERSSNERLMLVSSTSWTPDEDFEIILKAFKNNETIRDKWNLIVTGKGPLKEYFEEQFKVAEVKLTTAWLEPEDYPKLLAVADMGLCLHHSSSGLDIPMKAVDMLGCGLPVLASDYPCLRELLIPSQTGLHFSDSKDLAEHLMSVPAKLDEVAAMRVQIRKDFAERWPSYWQREAGPCFR